MFVVLHVAPDAPSELPAVLSRSGPLPAHHPKDGEPIRSGRIYVAFPDRHLLVERDRVRVVRGPKENRHRPAVDALFRSAAVVYGSRVIGVVLSGSLSDGAAGVLAIRRRGGLVIVQDPADAPYPSMPLHAMDMVEVDHQVRAAEMAALITRLVALGPTPVAPPPREMHMEARMSAGVLEELSRRIAARFRGTGRTAARLAKRASRPNGMSP
jgi:two-component system chemotaxis response regulator CheB